MRPEEAWGESWEKKGKDALARYKLGSAYLLPMSGPPTNMRLPRAGPGPVAPKPVSGRKPRAWQPDDMLIMPIFLDSGQVAAVISLADPLDGLRPTEDGLRLDEHLNELIERPPLARLTGGTAITVSA